ncbi:SHOCT domain-containing protein [Actinomadura sp. ATCC 31491]|uniref:SHOCT domain-containing protein n=2 Tax=Actinomadura luzonensis TaxID=2805427 RepID=A0ABT0FSW8_9ACTN|nr:SHOCT domain-containing protein [Actinomadura luzonensis]MCK2215253.1 SHOCT domain-containing protein [Actinomadura luzonensis]
MMWWGYDHMTGWGYALMGLTTVAFWALVITAIVLAVRAARRATGPLSPPPAAEELLAQRYARGEIDTEEYHTRLDTLRGRHDHFAGS